MIVTVLLPIRCKYKNFLPLQLCRQTPRHNTILCKQRNVLPFRFWLGQPFWLYLGQYWPNWYQAWNFVKLGLLFWRFWSSVDNPVTLQLVPSLPRCESRQWHHKVSNNLKTRHYGGHNVIYGKTWYSHDNSLGQAVPGTANLANEVIGRCQG